MKILCAKLDANIRYRLRMCIWKHWKTPQNRAKNLMKLGIDRITAYKVGYCSRAYAHVCSCGAVNIAITNKRLASFGLISMLDYYTERWKIPHQEEFSPTRLVLQRRELVMRRSLYFRSILFEIFGQVLMYQFQLFCFLLKGNVLSIY